MKLLLENWREYLLIEGMMTVDDLPDDVTIRIVQKGRKVAIQYADLRGRWRRKDTHEAPWGVVWLQPDDSENTQSAAVGGDGPCGNAWRVVNTIVSSGWGPLLYDVAIEYATAHGGGLTPDRGSVSAEAEAVWEYYLNKRSDVTNHQLDDLKNTLTSVQSDNCAQEVPKFSKKDSWPQSPLSKRYTKSPDTINKLEKIGKLY